MVGIIAIAMATAMRSPTTPNKNHPKSEQKIVRYWDGVWYSEFGFQAPTVLYKRKEHYYACLLLRQKQLICDIEQPVEIHKLLNAGVSNFIKSYWCLNT